MAKSLREMRRAQARKDLRLVRQMEASPIERQKAALFRNGITFKDVENEKRAAFADGKKLAEEFVFHTVYASILITMVENHGWEPDAAADLLREIDKQVVLCVEDQELVNEAFEKTGLRLQWDDPIERIQEG